MKRGDLVRLKHQYRLVGPMNLWDEWKLPTDEYAPETFRYFYENDLGVILDIEECDDDIIRGIKILTSRGAIGWISENLIEVLKHR